MNPWTETLAVTALAVFGALLGWGCSRLRAPWWGLGYLVPMSVVLVRVVVARRPEWALHPLIAWQWTGRWAFAGAAAAVAMLFATLVPKLPVKRDRWALGGLVIVLVSYLGIWPTVSAAWSRDRLMSLVTSIPPDGVCRQSTDYTCGPAAAVTVLRRLGVSAEEGALALAAGTSPAVGTPPEALVRAIKEQFGSQGVRAELHGFRSVDDLSSHLPALVVVRFGLLLDHWLCVIENHGEWLTVADPLSGPVKMSRSELESRWRHEAVTLRRESR